MTITCSQIFSKSAGDTLNVAVDFADMLTSTEVLTGTPTVTCTGLTLAGKAVNSVAITTPSGDTLAIGNAVTFSVAGGTAGTDYSIDVTVSTNSTPAQTIQRLCKLSVV